MSQGAPEPLGVAPDPDGVNVAIQSANATAIELCLFDASDRETRRITLPERTGGVWHAHVAGVAPGAHYGLRAHGPWDPAHGHRFNPAKLLIDPHALALDRTPRLHPAMFGQQAGDTMRAEGTDSAPFMPKGIVTRPPDLAPAARPETPWSRSVIYELHVRGFTKLHPDIPEPIRGTFAALAHPAALAHLTALGVTAVEIMPCATWLDERHLGPLGLTNYWGYNPVAFMAPDPRLAPGGWPEVRAAVAALAEAGIETILDVVFNHTGEGDELGPTVSLRGLDNAEYYRLLPDDPSRYVNDTGCGHTLACDRPPVVRLVCDALRAWVAHGGVHGFRFDLGATLGRFPGGFDPHAPLLTAITQDPLLRQTKLISEPWDIGPGGYRLGAFPGSWGEWNDRFRDDVRRFWRGDPAQFGPLATRMAGSDDILDAHHRPSRGINFVAAHDGFTLADLVSYERKHNEANGERNRDGSDDNHSWNHGVEGATADPAIAQARRQDQAAMLATLLFARGTPMLAMGSEMGHSQGGNNNAYSQDGPVSWLNWGAADSELLAHAIALLGARRAHPALCADRFLTGQPIGPGEPADVAWLRADSAPMWGKDWDGPPGETMIVVFAVPGDRVAIAFNRGATAAALTLPPPGAAAIWDAEIGSLDAAGKLPPRSVTLFREVRPSDPSTAPARDTPA